MPFQPAFNNYGTTAPGFTHDIAPYYESLTNATSTVNGLNTLPNCGSTYCYNFLWSSSGYTESPQVQHISVNGNRVSLFPNPASNTINISYLFPAESENGISGLKLEIFDALGKQCYSENPGTNAGLINIDVNSYKNGLYFYRFTSNRGLLKQGKFEISK